MLWLEVNFLNTILAITIKFVCCNGKIILFTEINNSKKGYPTFWTAPYLRFKSKRSEICLFLIF